MNEHPLERAIRADLDWVLTAPSLLAPHPTLWSGDALQNEPRRPFSAEQLASLSRARRGKLGRYFEALVAYLFLASTGFRVLAQNRSIVADKRIYIYIYICIYIYIYVQWSMNCMTHLIIFLELDAYNT